MTPCDTLADVRSAIDQIDFMLVGLLAERGRYVREAARFEPEPHRCHAAAPEPAMQVIERALGHARYMGAAPEVVEAVYRTMASAFDELEKRHMATRAA